MARQEAADVAGDDGAAGTFGGQAQKKFQGNKDYKPSNELSLEAELTRARQWMSTARSYFYNSTDWESQSIGGKTEFIHHSGATRFIRKT